MSLKREYHVSGMSCMHCVNAVKEALEALSEVEEARVELKTGRLELLLSEEIGEEKVKKAVQEAGYQVK